MLNLRQRNLIRHHSYLHLLYNPGHMSIEKLPVPGKDMRGDISQDMLLQVLPGLSLLHVRHDPSFLPVLRHLTNIKRRALRSFGVIHSRV